MQIEFYRKNTYVIFQIDLGSEEDGNDLGNIIFSEAIESWYMDSFTINYTFCNVGTENCYNIYELN